MYTVFLGELPDVRDLADCDDDRLMKLWEGLGYYSRARNLKKAAQVIMKEHDGRFPDAYDAVLSLPGIGRCTAGAILSIAFGQPCPAVDGNVLRVLSRFLPSAEDIGSDAVKEEFAARLQPVYPPDTSSFTQALMELGALICLPNGAPLCGKCPLKEACYAGRSGEWDRYPVKTKKQTRKVEKHTVLILRSRDGGTALIRRPETGLLKGMWTFPDLPGCLTPAEIAAALKARFSVRAGMITALPETNHIFTHIEWKMRPYLIETETEGEGLLWVSPSELENDYALPTAHRKILSKIKNK